jgi:hypothetical protein
VKTEEVPIGTSLNDVSSISDAHPAMQKTELAYFVF